MCVAPLHNVSGLLVATSETALQLAPLTSLLCRICNVNHGVSLHNVTVKEPQYQRVPREHPPCCVPPHTALNTQQYRTSSLMCSSVLDCSLGGRDSVYALKGCQYRPIKRRWGLLMRLIPGEGRGGRRTVVGKHSWYNGKYRPQTMFYRLCVGPVGTSDEREVRGCFMTVVYNSVLYRSRNTHLM